MDVCGGFLDIFEDSGGVVAGSVSSIKQGGY